MLDARVTFGDKNKDVNSRFAYGRDRKAELHSEVIVHLRLFGTASGIDVKDRAENIAHR